MGGKQRRPSMTRMIAVSTGPRAYAAALPRTVPNPAATATLDSATTSVMRAPWSSRLRRSRPNSSVPSGWARVGGWALARGLSVVGSAGDRIVASAAARSKAPTTGPATRTWRDRRQAPRGEARSAGAVSGAGAATAGGALGRAHGSAMADPRVHDAIAEVGYEVHGHEERGAEQDDALDHRIVAGPQRAEKESVHPGPAEDVLHEHRAREHRADLEP